MKVLAFADVHLGTYRYPIRDHIIAAMGEIMEIAQERNPDLILFAGDAFRYHVPAARDVQGFGIFLDALSVIAPVYMIPGNHDLARDATTIDVYYGYRQNNGVRVITKPKVLIDNLWSAYKDHAIVAVPWLPQKAMASQGIDGTDTAGATRVLLDLLKSKVGDRPAILLAHCTALGTEYHDEAKTILGNDVLWTSDMFEGFELCVLGHLHKPQAVPGTDNAFYTGSICPVSFNETGQTKSVLFWESGLPVERIPLKSVPQFVQLDTASLPDVDDGRYANCFLQIKKEPDEPDPERIPVCLYSEIVPKKTAREARVRLYADEAQSLTAPEAILRWLEIEGYGDREKKVFKLLEELEEER